MQVTVKRKAIKPVRLPPSSEVSKPPIKVSGETLKSVQAEVHGCTSALAPKPKPHPNWIDSQRMWADFRGGHNPDRTDIINGWTFKRCRCGFSLVMTPTGEVWWLRVAEAPNLITDWYELFYALSRNCWRRRFEQ
jgi:hypothetical protein